MSNQQQQNLSKQEKERIFQEEFLPHADALYNFAYHLTYEDAKAQDLVQEAFLKAYRFTDSYQVGTNAKAWLFRILKNGFINQYRKKSRQPSQVDFDDFITFQEKDIKSDYHTLDLRDEIFQGMLGDEVTIAINSLPIDFKTVILLCDLEGFTYEEIADMLEIPIGTVRSRLHRARKVLKEKLREYAQSMGFKTEKRENENT